MLIVTDDTLSATMAGPAIRAFEMAKAISQVAKVKLASNVPTELSHQDFDIIDISVRGIRPLVDWAEIIVFQGALLSTQPWIAKTSKILVADIYDPMHLEVLEQLKSVPEGRRYLETLDITAVMNEQICRADYLICASDKQRDFWLGQMAALGRLNPFTYDSDSSLRNLIDSVPFGVQNEPPVMTKSGIRDSIPGISQTDKVVLWGGGIYNWFDPLTLVKAINQLASKHENIRLVFMGTQHPNPHVPEMAMSFRTRETAQKMGLLDKHVFFNEGWVPYDERANFLLDADLGVSTHLEHLETAFSFRTRILDYLWAGLPIVATSGDTFEQIIDNNRLGITVPPGDVDALADAIEKILYEPGIAEQTSQNVRSFAETMTWSVALNPLITFIQNSQRSADSGNSYVKQMGKLNYLQRRSLRQRIMFFVLSSKLNGIAYSFNLFFNNLKRKIRRSLKTSK